MADDDADPKKQGTNMAGSRTADVARLLTTPEGLLRSMGLLARYIR